MSNLDELATEVDAEPASVGPSGTPADPTPALPVPIKTPLDMRGNQIASKINTELGKIVSDDDLPATCFVGESAALVLEDKMGTASLPSHYWLIGSCIAFAGALAVKSFLKAKKSYASTEQGNPGLENLPVIG